MTERRVQVFEDASAFEAAVRSYVQEHAAEASVLATVLADVVAGARSYSGSTWLAVEEDGDVVGVAMQTPPHRLWLSPMTEEAAGLVAEVMAERAAPGSVPGVAGEEQAAEAARRRWNALRPEERIRPVRRMRLYVLGALRPPVDVHGTARRADHEDLDLLMRWWEAFAVEADVAPAHPREAIEPRLQGHGALFVWEVEGRPVAMAGHTVTVAGTTRVGPVYTPPDDRRRGYGAAVTAVATQNALDEGASDVVLFTDLGNPVSNSIYQRIGYRPVRDYAEMDTLPSGD